MADPHYPADLRYHPEHDWARIDGDSAVFGITWYAQDELGDVVFFDPPDVGTTVTAGEPYAEVESVKAVSDVVAPMSGEIVEVNTSLKDGPEKINDDPYGDGWLVKVALSDPSQAETMLDDEAYTALLDVSRYTSVTPDDLQTMLATIGVASVDELFARQIPAALRLDGPLDLPEPMGEQAVFAHLLELASRNVSAQDELTFVGGGMYDHYVPAIIDMLMSRSEFLTPYTPYQPEVSQGTLQVMFEYQTAISELTGLPVSNASVYEGPSAVASAGYLARLANKRPKFVVSAGLMDHSLATLRTYAHGYGAEIVEVPLADGVTDAAAWAAAIDDQTAAVFVQQPNFLGAVEDVAALAAAAHERGGDELVVVGAYDPIVLGILAAPGDCGVDVCVGEGQSLGNRLDFGGPSFGFFAATEAHLRQMPGRIVGETTDVDGKRGFVLTLQTREQHIRRERATSNICTAQALNALGGMVYLAWLGRAGLVELGELLLQRTHYARETLCAIEGVSAWHEQPVIREFALRLDVGGAAERDAVLDRCREHGVNPGLVFEDDGLIVAITEQRSRADIDRLADVLGAAVAAVRARRAEVPA